MNVKHYIKSEQSEILPGDNSKPKNVNYDTETTRRDKWKAQNHPQKQQDG